MEVVGTRMGLKLVTVILRGLRALAFKGFRLEVNWSTLAACAGHHPPRVFMKSLGKAVPGS